MQPYTEKDLLNFIKTKIQQDEYKIIENILDPKEADFKYCMKWRGVVAAESKRLLLFGIGDSVHNTDDSEGDLSWFLQLIESYGFKIIFNPEKDMMIRLLFPNNDTMAFLYPCCPKCHTILPGQWFHSIEYFPVSLLGSPSSGKSTLLCSWLVDGYAPFNDLQQLGEDILAVDGIPGGKSHFEIQEAYYKAADDMKKNGNYPLGTDAHSIPPIYIQITHRKSGESLLVGIYDCSGELLDKAADMVYNATQFIYHMKAFIYLVPPEQMAGVHMQDNNQKEELPCILTIEEQGEYQRNMSSREISAELLLADKEIPVEDPWGVYQSVQQVLAGSCGESEPKHMAYTIVKSDLLTNQPEVKSIPRASELLRRPNADTIRNSTYIEEYSDIARQMFEKLVFTGTEAECRAAVKAKIDYFDGRVSWHCICAANKKREGQLNYYYTPIRNVEPLVGCLVNKLKELTWIK